MEIAQRASQVVDLSQMYLGDVVADAHSFIKERNIMPSDQEEGDAVALVYADQHNYSRIYKDGRKEPISKETYVAESIYNFLPERFKTYRPNG
jgi:hypothetical protein